MATCNFCKAHISEKADDRIVMCNHHKGAVHYSCCADECSMHGSPCEHAHAIYKKE